MSIHNSSRVSVRGKNTFNDVHGNQVNTMITAAGVVNIHSHDTTATAKNTIFGEFDYVKRGHVIGMQDLGSVDLSEWNWHCENGELVLRRPKFARKTISTVQIHPNQQSNFTAITNEGEDAQEAWEDDFKQFSRASRTGLFKLFGVNRSHIPMLIFHNELIPAAHFYTGSFWMYMYIHCLLNNKQCSRSELWLDTSRGVLCKGPIGPDISGQTFYAHEYVIQALPSTVDMLEEGPFIAFFSKSGSNVDSDVLPCAWLLGKQTYLDDLFPKMTQDHQHKDNNYPQFTTDHPYLEHLWRNPPRYLPIDIIA
ncbi:hypothetical protein MPER_06752, partial [Moniliophthora perniciosa FA553]